MPRGLYYSLLQYCVYIIQVEFLESPMSGFREDYFDGHSLTKKGRRVSNTK